MGTNNSSGGQPAPVGRTCPYYDPDDVAHLHKSGAWLVPRKAGEKRPIVKDWGGTRLSLDEVLAHIERGAALSVIPHSLGLAVVDVDRGGTEAVEDAKKVLGKPLSEYESSPGKHHLLYPAPTVSNYPKTWENGDLLVGEPSSRKLCRLEPSWFWPWRSAMKAAAKREAPDFNALPRKTRTEANRSDAWNEGNRNNTLYEATKAVERLPESQRHLLYEALRTKAQVVGLSEAEVNKAMRDANEEPTPKRPLVRFSREHKPDDPPAVLRAPGDSFGSVLAEGEICVLSAAGGVGKSFLTLQLANAATMSPTTAMEEECGLQVRSGPVVVVSYEDSAIRLQNRWHLIRDLKDPNNKLADDPDLVALDKPAPLWLGATAWPAPSPAGPGSEWNHLWATVAETEASLVIIDPATASFTGAAHDVGEVREYMCQLAAKAEEHKCGVLMVAHSTKAARYDANAGAIMGAGAVSGSAAWHDAARSVLTFQTLAHGDRLLVCMKANYGPVGWGVRLEAIGGKEKGQPFQGFETKKPLSADGVVEVMRQEAIDRNPKRPRNNTRAEPAKDNAFD